MLKLLIIYTKIAKNEKSSEKGKYNRSSKKLNIDMFCENCNYYGHIMDNCYYIIGFSEKKKNENKSKDDDSKKKKAKIEVANIVSYLTDEDCKILNYSLHSTIHKVDDWICYLGASQHMIGN